MEYTILKDYLFKRAKVWYFVTATLLSCLLWTIEALPPG